MPNAPTRRRAWALALLSGALMALAFPGSGSQAWLAFVALVPLLVAIDGVSRARAAALGSVSAGLFWLITISWTAPGVAGYAGLSVLQTLVLLVLIVASLTAFTTAFCALLAGSSVRSPAAWVVVAASLWVALELIRTDLVVRFPWNLLGTSQYRNLPLIQVAAVTGVYGVSFVVLAVNAALARLVLAGRRWLDAAGALAAASFALGGALAVGWLVPARIADAPRLPVALVQGNIDQGVKWDPAYQDETLRVYRALTVEAAKTGAELIVWPETSVPLLRADDPKWARVAAIARDTRRYLLVGAPDWEHGRPRNSAFLFDPAGRVIGRYDKHHLVPLGEYVPYEHVLFFLDWIAGGGVGQFVPGSGPSVLATPLGRLGIDICYEAIFPAEVRQLFVDGAGTLVNITNDAWFGRSPAPVQHLAMAVFRAVENRAYLVRAANSGISAIVAPDGRIVRASRLFTREVVAGSIVVRAAPSFYTRHGDLFAWIALGIATVVFPLPARLGRARRERGGGAGATSPAAAASADQRLLP